MVAVEDNEYVEIVDCTRRYDVLIRNCLNIVQNFLVNIPNEDEDHLSKMIYTMFMKLNKINIYINNYINKNKKYSKDLIQNSTDLYPTLNSMNQFEYNFEYNFYNIDFFKNVLKKFLAVKELKFSNISKSNEIDQEYKDISNHYINFYCYLISLSYKLIDFYQIFNFQNEINYYQNLIQELENSCKLLENNNIKIEDYMDEGDSEDPEAIGDAYNGTYFNAY